MYVLIFLMWISYWFEALYVVIHVLTHSSEFLICCRAFAISAAMDPGEPEDMLLSFWWYFNLGHPRFFQENVRFKKSFGSTQHVIKKTIERLAKKKSKNLKYCSVCSKKLHKMKFRKIFFFLKKIKKIFLKNFIG